MSFYSVWSILIHFKCNGFHEGFDPFLLRLLQVSLKLAVLLPVSYPACLFIVLLPSVFHCLYNEGQPSLAWCRWPLVTCLSFRLTMGGIPTCFSTQTPTCQIRSDFPTFLATFLPVFSFSFVKITSVRYLKDNVFKSKPRNSLNCEFLTLYSLRFLIHFGLYSE